MPFAHADRHGCKKHLPADRLAEDRAARGRSRFHRVYRYPFSRPGRRGGRHLEGHFLRSFKTRHVGKLRQSARWCAGLSESR